MAALHDVLIEPGDPRAMRPLTAPRNFVAIVAGALDDLPGVRVRLDETALHVTTGLPGDVDGVLTSPLAPVYDLVGGDINNAPGLPAGQLVAAGDNSDRIRQDSKQYLPPIDTPIQGTFDPPPPTPGQVRPGPPDIPNPDLGG